MTGFARVRRPLGEAELVVTLKSVNHRALDLHFHTGPEFDPYESAIRAAIKRAVARGHVSIRIAVERPAGTGGLSLDRARLAGYMDAFREGSKQYGLVGEPDLNAAFRVPGILVDRASCELPPNCEPTLVGATEEAVAQLNEFRAREGCEIATLLRRHNATIEAAAVKIEQIRSQALEAFHARLQERLRELLANTTLDPQRLAQEAAILADRSDIGEETARLRIHSRQLEQILASGGEVGKKLDFLLQEMNREANTILSKTAGTGESGRAITDLALAAKSEIEKIREQSLNLE
ncbi:MAG TPA: YicC/YloC family endoribonuclease [Bryobacteraceae bacterium]|nr:YicC/YloC family endoribonuclease [Bryobacteraceae bacterium]